MSSAVNEDKIKYDNPLSMTLFAIFSPHGRTTQRRIRVSRLHRNTAIS